MPTKAELETQLRDARKQNDKLQKRLDQIDAGLRRVVDEMDYVGHRDTLVDLLEEHADIHVYSKFRAVAYIEFEAMEDEDTVVDEEVIAEFLQGAIMESSRVVMIDIRSHQVNSVELIRLDR